MAFRNLFIDAMMILNFWFNYFWGFLFRNGLCKIEDFVNLAESITKVNEVLFVWHINSRWSTLSLALEQTLKRWKDSKKYFLEHIPKQKEYKNKLTSNKRYQGIKKCFTELEKVYHCYVHMKCFILCRTI